MATSGINDANFPKNLDINDRTEWVPLSLTLVEYPRGDFIGKFLALISLAPFGIGAGFVALILFRRDLHTITFFLGTLCSEALNYCLKHTICEERPLRRSDLYGEYGMPSSHAQFVWFFATYVVYFVFIRLHHMNNNTIIENVSKILILSSSLIMALLVCISRIYLQYHTVSQVLCGALLGILFATFWFALTYLVFTPLFPQIVSWYRWLIHKYLITSLTIYVMQPTIHVPLKLQRFQGENLRDSFIERHDADTKRFMVRIHEHSARG